MGKGVDAEVLIVEDFNDVGVICSGEHSLKGEYRHRAAGSLFFEN